MRVRVGDEVLGPVWRSTEQSLSRRELEIVELVADGLMNREIAQRLYVSEETVKTHIHHALVKLHARSRAHAVALALRRGLIE